MGLIFTFILVQLLNLKTTSIQAGIWTKLSVLNCDDDILQSKGKIFLVFKCLFLTKNNPKKDVCLMKQNFKVVFLEHLVGVHWIQQNRIAFPSALLMESLG